jgi:hypothetical protein
MTGRETAVRLVGVLAAAGALAGGVGGALAAGSLTGGGPEPTANAREASASAGAGLRAGGPATQALRTPVLTPTVKAERKKPRAHRRARPKRTRKVAARRRAVTAYQPAPAVTASLPDTDTTASGTTTPAPARGGTIVTGRSPAVTSRPSPEPAAKAPVRATPKPEPVAAKKPAPQPDPAGPTGTFDDSG